MQGYVLNLGQVPYLEAWEVQRSAGRRGFPGRDPGHGDAARAPAGGHARPASQGQGELHIPVGAEVGIVETDRGGKSTSPGPGQLVCYPIFDLTRHEQDVKRLLQRPRGGLDPDS